MVAYKPESNRLPKKNLLLFLIFVKERDCLKDVLLHSEDGKLYAFAWNRTDAWGKGFSRQSIDRKRNKIGSEKGTEACKVA